MSKDTISDILTCIRNADMAKKETVRIHCTCTSRASEEGTPTPEELEDKRQELPIEAGDDERARRRRRVLNFLGTTIYWVFTFTSICACMVFTIGRILCIIRRNG